VNRRGITAVVRRDLSVAMGSKALVLPAIIVPAVLLVLLPLLAGLVPRMVDAAALSDLDAVREALPADRTAGLPEDPGLAAAVLAVSYLLVPMILIVPVMFASIIAADGVAGEKERGTLEGLLLTPLTDREVAAAKLLAAWVPAVVIGLGGALLYAVVANLTVAPLTGRLVLPTAEFVVMALWVGPTFAAASLGAVSLVSVRVSTTQEAFQVGGFVIVPVVALLISQASGALLLSVTMLLIAGLVAAALAGGLIVAAARSLARPRLGPRLG
jgi:ABC-type Na+ efflux pump permease subunit